jgi:predicted kinase
MKRLILVRGLPGSGKTTMAQQIVADMSAAGQKAIMFEADMFHMINGEYKYDTTKVKDAHDWCRLQAACHLNKGLNVVIANTFTTNKEIKPYFDLALKYETEMLLCEATGNYKNLHNVPEDVIAKMKERWELYNADAMKEVELYEVTEKIYSANANPLETITPLGISTEKNE